MPTRSWSCAAAASSSAATTRPFWRTAANTPRSGVGKRARREDKLSRLALATWAKTPTETAGIRSEAMRYLHTMVRVADLDKALGFYCGALGLTEARRIDNPG